MTIEMTRDGFAERVFTAMLGAFEVASIYLGEKLGLYAALAEGGPATSGELAERAGIAERYAREWLEQQAAVGYLTVDDAGARPRNGGSPCRPGHAAVLVDQDSGVTYSERERAAMVRGRGGRCPSCSRPTARVAASRGANYGEDMFTGQE